MHAFLPLDNYCTCGDANGPCCAILPQHQGMRRAALGCLAAAAALAPAKRDWRCAFDAAFAGDFDNYAQVAAERARGVAAADRAGHEHVHCCLRPLRAAEAAPLVGAAARVVLACYYLDGAPENVFRLRCYAFDDERRMALLRPPRAALAAAHAACADLPARGAAARAAALAATGRWEPLGGCDVAWRPVDGGFDGAMADPGGCVVLSQRDGTTRVRVKDALALRDDVLEVDDRGYALDGTLLYGSPDGGPYRLARVQGTRDQGGDP